MEGILHAASEAKELLVHEVEKLHLHGNNDSSSSSSSSDDEDESAEKFPRIESAVVALKDKLSSSSSSSSDEEEEEAPVQDPVAPTKSEVVGESCEIETNRVGLEGPEPVIDELESSESDEKVIPIEEEETIVVADTVETGYLVSKESEDSPPVNIPVVESGSGSGDEIPVSSGTGSPVLITTVTHQVRSLTSWMSCCGLFDVLKRDR